jgi:hypothetical protein
VIVILSEAKDPYLLADDEKLDRSFGRASLRLTRALIAGII